jgi:hypothetical protein
VINVSQKVLICRAAFKCRCIVYLSSLKAIDSASQALILGAQRKKEPSKLLSRGEARHRRTGAFRVADKPGAMTGEESVGVCCSQPAVIASLIALTTSSIVFPLGCGSIRRISSQTGLCNSGPNLVRDEARARLCLRVTRRPAGTQS